VKGKAEYPPDHQAGMEVPPGGSSCKSCEYLKDAEKRICGNEYFIAWNGSEVIPKAIDRYCSDWYKEKKAGSRMAEALKNGRK
jgi:hypothetical protein